MIFLDDAPGRHQHQPERQGAPTTTYRPAPQAIPIAVANHKLAAVVRLWTSPPFTKIRSVLNWNAVVTEPIWPPGKAREGSDAQHRDRRATPPGDQIGPPRSGRPEQPVGGVTPLARSFSYATARPPLPSDYSGRSRSAF